MSTNRDFDRIAGAWLAEGPSELADRVLDAALREVHLTSQRRRWSVPWRTSLMQLRLGAAALVAIVAVTGLVAFNMVGGAGSGPPASPEPTVTPSPSPSPSPSPTVATVADGPLSPGRYHIGGGLIVPGLPMTITVPSGWSGFRDFAVGKDYGPAESDAGPLFGVWEITNRYVDPCTDHTLVSPPPGPGIDELLDALASQPGVQAGPATDVTIDGYRGKSIELTVTTDIATCGYQGFWLWWGGDRRYVQVTGEMDRIYLLDIDGVRHTFNVRITPRTTPTDRAELAAIVASIDIEQ